jgi:hypothetical protein
MPKKIEIKDTVIDDRFKVVAEDPDYEINRFSEDYMLRHPHLKKQLQK